MRVIPFPGHDGASVEESWLAELDAALSGDAHGPAAERWRELREDVRALAPAGSQDFERELRERVLERDPTPRRSRLRLRLRLAQPSPPALAAILAACSVLIALAVAHPWQGKGSGAAVPARSRATGVVAPASAGGAGASSAAKAAAKADELGPSAPSVAAAPSAGAGASAPGRVQELGATVTFAVTPSQVQQTADRISRLVVNDGGFVQSAHVQVQQGQGGEANLTLKLPSEKLSAALASLERIAPVRDESQSLQDITNSYDAARQRLADANAERQALLHALSRAVTEGQIDSLRERLAQSRGAVASAHAALEALSRRASTAEVEVSVLGSAHASSEGLTLHRGLHDAGRVLMVALVVALIAAAVLLPLALVLAALALSARKWRRYRRERALETA
jgi:hypothetical protein